MCVCACACVRPCVRACVCVVFSSSRRSHVASLFTNKEQKRDESDVTRYGYLNLILFPSNTVKSLPGSQSLDGLNTAIQRSL